MFPLRIAFDPRPLTSGSATMLRPIPHAGEFGDHFSRRCSRTSADYRLPVIRLASETPKEAVCTVFEKVNTGGVLAQRIRAAHRHVRG